MTTDSKHFLSGRKIIVSGAGIGGLTFVLSLLQFWDTEIPPPEVVIVDTDSRDESINRWPYELLLNSEIDASSLVALRDLGLYDKVKARAEHSAHPGAVANVWDKSWKPVLTVKPKLFEGFTSSSLRISRTALLTVLIEALEAKTKITWKTSVHDAKRLPDGRLSVSLLDKASGATSQQECDVLVAADGDESTIRKLFRPKDISQPTGHVAMGGAVDFGSLTSVPSEININSGIIVSGDGVASGVLHIRGNGTVVWALYKEEKSPRTDYDKKDKDQFAAGGVQSTSGETLSELVVRLDSQFEDDIGLFVLFFLNFVKLQAGEALFLVADDIHAYVSGDIIECMAASDNVVRAGFTPKFKDVSTLVDMLTYNYAPIDEQKMTPTEYPYATLNRAGYSSGSAVLLYDPPIDEFAVVRSVLRGPDAKATFEPLDGPSIVICTNGSGTISVGPTSYEMKEGYVFFVGSTAELVLESTTGEDEEFTTFKAFCEVDDGAKEKL
ncbi:hypothetical protein NLG97_g8732 [Lecanicillium saksenae]|uniref:Uncharacterized protein n=1 Tax=Lecanicillium saksenae TaxID=468837 RepID=A0ACC1QJV1_9HYPO|nr:hypothetical protein NLG97_g8732 [Lecanicillium saksenae]